MPFAVDIVPARGRRRVLLLCAALIASALPGPAQITLHAQTPRSSGLTLAQVVELARDSSTASQIAGAGARIAQLAVGLSAAPLLPFASLDAGATRLTQNLATFGFPGPSAASEPFNVYTGGVRVQQTLVDVAAWQRVGAQRDSARAGTADADAARDGAVTAAAARFFVVLAAGASLDGRQADSVVAHQILSEVTARRTSGEATDIDVTRARLGLTASGARVTDARAMVEQARLDLALALSLPRSRVDHLADSLRAPRDEDLAAFPASAEMDAPWQAMLQRRPDVRASAERRRAASAMRRAARFEYLPRIAAVGEYQSAGVEPGVLPTVYRYGVQVSIPLLDGFSRVQRTSLLREQERIANTVHRDTELRAQREARGAAVDLERAIASARVAEAQLALSLEELRQARERVRAGIGTTLETTQALAATAAAREGVVGTRLQYHLARVEWHRATATLGALR